MPPIRRYRAGSEGFVVGRVTPRLLWIDPASSRHGAVMSAELGVVGGFEVGDKVVEAVEDCVVACRLSRGLGPLLRSAGSPSGVAARFPFRSARDLFHLFATYFCPNSLPRSALSAGRPGPSSIADRQSGRQLINLIPH